MYLLEKNNENYQKNIDPFNFFVNLKQRKKKKKSSGT